MHRLVPCARIHLLSSRRCSSVPRFSDLGMTPLGGAAAGGAGMPRTKSAERRQEKRDDAGTAFFEELSEMMD